VRHRLSREAREITAMLTVAASRGRVVVREPTTGLTLEITGPCVL
jgi:hypothetical protein